MNALAEIAQLVEHATENRGVVSSILSLGTWSEDLTKYSNCGCSSVVERLLAKEKVESSNLFARSPQPWRRSQVGKARVCKTCSTGSNPVVASNEKRKMSIAHLFCFNGIFLLKLTDACLPPPLPFGHLPQNGGECVSVRLLSLLKGRGEGRDTYFHISQKTYCLE